MTEPMFRIYIFIYEKFLPAKGSVLNSMYRLGLIDMLVFHTNIVWRPPWLYASSVKEKQSKIWKELLRYFFLGKGGVKSQKIIAEMDGP